MFDAVTLKHLGSLATVQRNESSTASTVASSISTVHTGNDGRASIFNPPSSENSPELTRRALIDVQMINDGKKMISVYTNGNVVIWNMVKHEKELSPNSMFEVLQTLSLFRALCDAQ